MALNYTDRLSPVGSVADVKVNARYLLGTDTSGVTPYLVDLYQVLGSESNSNHFLTVGEICDKIYKVENGKKPIIGPPGDEGLIGPQGTQGARAASIQGVAGDRGIIGEKGYEGDIGLQGLQGAPVTSILGNYNGPRGVQGKTSTVQGEKGYAGPQGAVASNVPFDELKGLQGCQGLKGASGSRSAGSNVYVISKGNIEAYAAAKFQGKDLVVLGRVEAGKYYSNET